MNEYLHVSEICIGHYRRLELRTLYLLHISKRSDMTDRRIHVTVESGSFMILRSLVPKSWCQFDEGKTKLIFRRRRFLLVKHCVIVQFHGLE